MKNENASALDKLQAGLLGRDGFREEVLNQVYSGLHQYCRIPDGYRHCELATQAIDIEAMDDDHLRELLDNSPADIVNPYPSQIKAIKLFELLLSGDSMVCDNDDPLRPTLGAYLYGPPGTGKTHLMAAYGRKIIQHLGYRLRDIDGLLDKTIEDAFLRYNERVASEIVPTEVTGYHSLEGDEIVQFHSPEDEFWNAIATLKAQVAGYEYQPTDIIYIGFQELFEICKHASLRGDAMNALESARIVFIDDVHPQGDPEQIQLVLHLLERRYEMGRSGTFLSTNLETGELGGGDEMLGKRLISRCAEMLMLIDFSDCKDWRQTVKSRKIKLVEKALAHRVASHKHRGE
jgi:hypothetical protein